MREFTEAEKYKLTLFGVVRNSQVMPVGMKLGKDMHEINKMSVETVNEVLEMCDFDILQKMWEDGNERKTD